MRLPKLILMPMRICTPPRRAEPFCMFDVHELHHQKLIFFGREVHHGVGASLPWVT
jgi:hypothetical protein